MINKILTTPRSNMNMGVQGAPGLQIGGGIAGFASKYEAPSIKVYNERQKYNEWEFVYDMKKDKRLLGQAAGMMPNQQQNPLGNGNVPNPLQPNQGNNSSFNQGNSFNQGQGGFNQGQGGSIRAKVDSTRIVDSIRAVSNSSRCPSQDSRNPAGAKRSATA